MVFRSLLYMYMRTVSLVLELMGECQEKERLRESRYGGRMIELLAAQRVVGSLSLIGSGRS
jgi:hypothetical protein